MRRKHLVTGALLTASNLGYAYGWEYTMLLRSQLNQLLVIATSSDQGRALQNDLLDGTAYVANTTCLQHDFEVSSYELSPQKSRTQIFEHQHYHSCVSSALHFESATVLQAST